MYVNKKNSNSFWECMRTYSFDNLHRSMGNDVHFQKHLQLNLLTLYSKHLLKSLDCFQGNACSQVAFCSRCSRWHFSHFMKDAWEIHPSHFVTEANSDIFSPHSDERLFELLNYTNVKPIVIRFKYFVRTSIVCVFPDAVWPYAKDCPIIATQHIWNARFMVQNLILLKPV